MYPKVSIIIPVYNSEKYIDACLNSVLNQSYKNIEVVIVNDGSKDNSLKAIQKYNNIDKRIKLIDQENSGPSEARNNGIIYATGRYIVFIDCDDTVESLYIEKLVNKINTENLDLVCCGYKDLSEYGKIDYTDFKFKGNQSVIDFAKLVCKGTGGVPWGKIYKKDIIVKHNLKMDKEIFMCEDLVFVLEYVSHCKSFGCVDEHLYNYNRLNQNSISSNISIQYIENYKNVFERIRYILASINMEKDEIDEIIKDRIQGFTINLLEKQSLLRLKIGKLKALENIEVILSTDYIQQYISRFRSDNYIYKIYIKIIQSKKARNIYLYGSFLDTLKQIKRKIKKRG